MKRFLFTLFLLATLVIAAVYFIKKAAPSTRLDGIGIGTSTHLRVGVDGLPDALDLMTGMGVTWIREEFPWNEIQQTPGEFRWSYGDGIVTQNFDTLVKEAKKRNVKILAVLDGGPVFSAHVYPGMPVNSEELVRTWQLYVQAVVDRYGDRITAWEIGNRENTSIGWGSVLFPTVAHANATPDPEMYSQMLQLAYKIIKAKNSSAQVILGGLELNDQDCSENPFAFLAGVQKSGGWQSFDAIGVQLIGRTSWPEQSIPSGSEFDPLTGECKTGEQRFATVLEDIRSVEAFSKQFGEKPIWITELGYNIMDIQQMAGGDLNQSSLVESDLLARTVVPILSEPSVKKVFWYTLADDPGNPGYGMGPFGQITLANLDVFLNGSQPLGQVQDPGLPADVLEYGFQNNGKTILVVWRASSESGTELATLTGLQGNSAVAYAADAAEISAATAQPLSMTPEGNSVLEVSESPLIVMAQSGDMAGRLQSSAQDQVDQVKDSLNSGAKALWDGAKTSISNQISIWLTDIKDSILQSIQQKLDQIFK